MMCKLLATLMCLFLLVACQAGTDYYGTGPLVLSPKVESVLRQNIHGKNGIRENLVIALDKRLRRFGGVYCPSSDIHSCIGGGSLSASRAVDNCNKDGKYDCWVYSIVDKIVWRGPIYLRDSSSGQRLPYHGVWPVSVSWDGVSDGQAELVLDQGKASLIGTAAGACELSFSPKDSRHGTVGFRCSNGSAAGGNYVQSVAQKVKGTGKDNNGREIEFELDLDEGKGAPGKPIT
jgi:hypothetical protein